MSLDISFEKEGGFWDISLNDNGDIASKDSFDTELLYALLGERRASESEVAVSQNRRGWIGNEGEDFENGSKLWIFEQSRLTRSVLNDMQSVALDALNYLIQNGKLANIKASTTLSNGVVLLELQLLRFQSEVDVRFYEVWENTGV